MLTAALHTLALLASGPSERLLPEVALVGFTGTEARALDDFLGQVVLLDFFAHWCAPCARQVPHLNELVDAYGAQGLHVLGVTGDDAPTAAEWLERLEARYPHARDAELRFQVELGFRPLPFAVLVDASGLIVWQGHPGELPLETVEDLLAEALASPAGRWPAEARPVREALRARRYAEAEAAARAIPEQGAELARFVGRLVARHGQLLESAMAAGDFLGAEELASALQAGCADGPIRARAAAVRAEIAGNEGSGKVLAGQLRLRELWSGVGSIATLSEAEALADRIRALAATHPGTQVERSAGAHLATLQALKSVLR